MPEANWPYVCHRQRVPQRALHKRGGGGALLLDALSFVVVSGVEY